MKLVRLASCFAVMMAFAISMMAQERIRWKQGNEGAEIIYRNGEEFRGLTAQGVTVWVGYRTIDVPGRWRAKQVNAISIGVRNQGPDRIEIDPMSVVLRSYKRDRTDSLGYVPASEIAQNLANVPEVAIFGDRLMWALFGTLPYNRTVDQAQARAGAGAILQNELRKNTLFPNEMVGGSMFFDYEKDQARILLEVPIKNVLLEFPFGWAWDLVPE